MVADKNRWRRTEEHQIETEAPENQKDHAHDPRESIWSLVAGARYWYFSIFAILYLSIMGVTIYLEIRAESDIIEKWQNIMLALGPLAMASAATSFTFTESWRGIMVIAHGIQKWFEERSKRRIQKAEERGVAKGRAEERQLWMEWLDRQKEAEARGEHFTEPPPNGKV